MRRKQEVSTTCKVCEKDFTTYSKILPEHCSAECKKITTNAYHRKRRQTMNGVLRSITAGCRNRAKRKGFRCDIDAEYVISLYEKQKGLCARTNMKLEVSNAKGKTRWNPNTVTLDRVDSKRGYTKDNVQLVTIMYNNCKSNFSHDDVIRFCLGVMSKHER